MYEVLLRSFFVSGEYNLKGIFSLLSYIYRSPTYFFTIFLTVAILLKLWNVFFRNLHINSDILFLPTYFLPILARFLFVFLNFLTLY